MAAGESKVGQQDDPAKMWLPVEMWDLILQMVLPETPVFWSDKAVPQLIRLRLINKACKRIVDRRLVVFGKLQQIISHEFDHKRVPDFLYPYATERSITSHDATGWGHRVKALCVANTKFDSNFITRFPAVERGNFVKPILCPPDCLSGMLSLRELRLYQCPDARVINLPALETLTLEHGQGCRVQIGHLVALSRLSIWSGGCPVDVDWNSLPSINTLWVQGMCDVDSHWDGIRRINKVNLRYSSMLRLCGWIGIVELDLCDVCLTDIDISATSSLQRLKLDWCRKLTTLKVACKLRSLEIYDCSNVDVFYVEVERGALVSIRKCIISWDVKALEQAFRIGRRVILKYCSWKGKEVNVLGVSPE